MNEDQREPSDLSGERPVSPRETPQTESVALRALGIDEDAPIGLDPLGLKGIAIVMEETNKLLPLAATLVQIAEVWERERRVVEEVCEMLEEIVESGDPDHFDWTRERANEALLSLRSTLHAGSEATANVHRSTRVEESGGSK